MPRGRRSAPLYQAPLYPYFLGAVYAVAGADPGSARVVQAVLGSASAVLLLAAAARLLGPRDGRAGQRERQIDRLGEWRAVVTNTRGCITLACPPPF
ncbi:MAG: hypothetical protein KA371_00520 [Acidobacteria bacterium]|nr:hypothetical protein [Acidobacteriota bacterium]